MTARPAVVVDTPFGRLRGSRAGAAVTFKGIPFAAAPTGERRFSAPAPPEPWPGERDATDYGPISLQHLDPLAALIPGCEWNFYHPHAVQSEDCLNLNVWAPADGASEPLPVLVWIHGGAFLAGSGTGLWCDGSHLAAEHGIVVVTVNYRLGALGGLAVDPEATTANSMLRDQVQALRWVRESIGAFGGDPGRVTIGGESAGAMSVVSLLTSPEARGLFHGAIVQSGHAGLAATVEHAHSVAERYLRLLGLDETPDPLAALRAVEVERLLDAQRELAAEVMVPFRPVVDEIFHPGPLLEAFAAGDQAPVPLLIGTNTDENNLFSALGWGPGAARGDLRSLISGLFDSPEPELLDEVAAMYEGMGDDAAAWNVLTTDRDWRGPTRDVATHHAASGAPVFVYELTYKSTALSGALGAAHAIDIPFVFGNLDQPGVCEFVGSDAAQHDERLAVQRFCVQAWSAFVRGGAPAASDLPPWPRYDAERRMIMAIGAEPAASPDPHRERVDRWEQLQPTAGLLGL